MGREAWEQIARVGLTGVGVPTELGGMGGDATDLVLVLEEAGRAALPDPVVATLGIAVPTLVASDAHEAADVLRAVAAGEATVGVWFADEPLLHDPGHDWVLRERDGAVWLLDAAALDDGTAVPSEDGTRRLRAVTDPGGGARLGGTELLAAARARAAAATAAELVGVADHLLDETLAYAKVRRQFAQPIGAFQAVAHELAGMFVELESARGAARHAARRLATDGTDASRAAHVAKLVATQAAARIETSALQLHGGIGFTWEHDLHLWLEARAGPAEPAR